MGKNSFSVLKILSLIGQLGISAVTPVFLFYFLGKFLVSRFQWQESCVNLFILFGIFIGLYSILRFIIREYQVSKKRQEEIRKERGLKP